MPSVSWLVRFAVCLVFMTGVVISAHAGFIVFSEGGSSDASSIDDTVSAYRTALGTFQEINWDGGGATTATQSGTPLTTFTDSRGATFTTPGTGFLQTPLDDPALTGINPSYATTFSVFSPTRIFTALGSNIMDVAFFLPGSGGATPATVSGFGVVFTDVDLASVTSIQLFDLENDLLGTFFVLPGTEANGSLSFLGLLADAGEQIARVRITTGNTALGPNDGGVVDVVAMDNFLFSQPAQIQAVSEPASLMLALIALLGMGLLRRVRWDAGNRYARAARRVQPSSTSRCRVSTAVSSSPR